MKNYSHLVYKQYKVNKRRNIYTVMGIILAIVLFTTVGILKNFIIEVNIEDIKNYKGNYEGIFKNITREQIFEIKNNVKIEDCGFLSLESDGLINVKDIKKNILVYALDKSSIENIFNERAVLEEGHFPEHKGEVTLEINAKSQLNKSIGDVINVGKVNYKIVGFYKESHPSSQQLIGISYFQDNNNYKDIYGFINIKEKRNIMKNILNIANKIGIYEIDSNIKVPTLILNEDLINQYDKSFVDGYNHVNEVNITFFLIDLFIGFLTIILTYGAINVSMKERIRYFSSLRCIGATPEKIRYLLIKESFILGLSSLIPGLLIAYGIAWMIINIVLEKVMKLNLYGVNLQIYWSIILGSILLIIIIILLASIIPVWRVGKISPMEGIKKEDTRLPKVKRRKSKFINKIFGYNGELAYKNIRANNKNFIITTTMLSVLLITFTVFTGVYYGMFNRINKEQNSNIKDFNIDLFNSSQDVVLVNSENVSISEIVKNDLKNKSTIETIDDGYKKINKIINTLNKIGGVKDISYFVDVNLYPIFTGVYATEHLKNKFEFKDKDEKYIYPSNSDMYIYDDESFERILPHVQGNRELINKLKNHGVILVNTNVETRPLNKEAKPILNIESGENLKIYLNSGSDKFDINNGDILNNINKLKDTIEPIELTVLGTIDTKYLPNEEKLENGNGIFFIVSKEFYEKNKNLLFGNEKSISSLINIEFNFLNKKARENNIESIKAYVNEIGGFYSDHYEAREKEKGTLIGIYIIIYTILLLTMCIGIINIINNKNINLSLRRKEIGTMLAIGMTKKSLRKIIILEGIIQWLISSLIGGVISFIVLKIIYILFNYMTMISTRNVPIWIIVIGIFILLIVSLISSIIPLRRFKSFNITEMMRYEE